MSSKYAALIVDSDVNGLESLVCGFQAAQWRITACPVRETASQLVRASGAHVVVVVSRSRHEKTHAMIAQLRANDLYRTLPILVLAPADARTSFKEDSNIEFLPLPVLMRDVMTASEILVETAKVAAQNAGDEAGIAVAVNVASTATLLRTLAGLERSVQIRLEHKGRQADIAFHQGELVMAQIAQLEGMAAIHHVLVWDKSATTVQLRQISRRGHTLATANVLIDEIDRFERDLAFALKDVGPLSGIYGCDEQRLQQATDIPSEVTPVVRLCDSQRILADVLSESPFRVLDTVAILARLAGLGILVCLEAPATAAPTSAEAQLEDFWRTAQIVGAEDAGELGGPKRRQTGESVTVIPAAASSGSLPVVPFAPAPSEAVTLAAAMAATPEQLRRRTLDLGMPSNDTVPNSTETGDTVSKDFVPFSLVMPPSGAVPEQASPAVEPEPLSVVPEPALTTTTTSSSVSGTFEMPQRRGAPLASRVVPQRSSVVIDAIFDASMEELPKPSPSTVTVNVTKDERERLIGEMQSTPARKSGSAKPAERVSIQLDAALTGDLAASAVTAAEPAAIAIAAAPAVVPPPAAAPPTGPAQPGSGNSRQQSGHFSPIEKDFFEREADLYKDLGSESFADLDAPAGRGGTKLAKNGSHLGNNGASKKLGRK